MIYKLFSISERIVIYLFQNGDYNQPIPGQQDAKLNSYIYTCLKPKNEHKSGNKLCDKCNLKQQFKVQQLASFVPMNEKNYDKEVEHFQ